MFFYELLYPGHARRGEAPDGSGQPGLGQEIFRFYRLLSRLVSLRRCHKIVLSGTLSSKMFFHVNDGGKNPQYSWLLHLRLSEGLQCSPFFEFVVKVAFRRSIVEKVLKPCCGCEAGFRLLQLQKCWNGPPINRWMLLDIKNLVFRFFND